MKLNNNYVTESIKTAAVIIEVPYRQEFSWQPSVRTLLLKHHSQEPFLLSIGVQYHPT